MLSSRTSVIPSNDGVFVVESNETFYCITTGERQIVQTKGFVIVVTGSHLHAPALVGTGPTVDKPVSDHTYSSCFIQKGEEGRNCFSIEALLSYSIPAAHAATHHRLF